MSAAKKARREYNIPVQKAGRSTGPLVQVGFDRENDGKLTFHFNKFDRSHELFNLGGVKEEWFIYFLDWLKEVSDKRAIDLVGGTYDLHPVDWETANTGPPQIEDAEQHEYWQIRLTKSRGRIVGERIKNDFYVVWLDVHHNLTDSEGYGGARYYPAPKTEYEAICEQKDCFEAQCFELRQQVLEYEEVMEQTCSECEHRQLALAT